MVLLRDRNMVLENNQTSRNFIFIESGITGLDDT